MTPYALDFTYNNQSLSDISEDLIIISFDDSGHNSGEDILNRSVQRSEISYDRPITYDYGAVDSNIYTFTITVCHESGNNITKAEVKALISWLMSPTSPQWLSFEEYAGDVYGDTYYKGRFIRASYHDIGGARKIGVQFDFENISPYAFTQEYIYSFPTSDGHMSDNILNFGTYVGKTVVPEITITPTATGVVTIQNVTDTSQDAFSIHVTNGEIVTIKDFNCYLSNGSLYDFSNLDNFNFPVMLDGINTFNITGDCQVQIKARYYEAVGV